FFMVVGSGSRRVRWLCLRQATFSAKPPPPSQISAAPAYTTFDHNSRTRPMLGFKSFRCARILLGGIEVMHMIVKGQLNDGGVGQTPAQQFYSLAG
ncbi:hypothetical protein V4C53_43250, partial [Paraburkholderia azotifigens]